jgi:hypothetical protein
MRGTFIAAAFATVAITAGCGSNTQTSPSTATNASASPPSLTTTAQAAPSVPSGPEPTSLKQLCDMQPWPRPVPAAVGILFEDAYSGSLMCWDDVKAIARDGHDVATSSDDMTQGRSYRIVDISPKPGTLIGQNDSVTVHVVPASLNSAQKSIYPCDWLTNDEAATILGGSSTTSDATDDVVGSVAPFCSYTSGSNFVTSQLYLPESFPVDAASEFLFTTALHRSDDAGPAQSTDVDGLSGPARCTTAQRDTGPLRELVVLLGGNRLYTVNGLNITCDTLKHFAAAAIAKIGP